MNRLLLSLIAAAALTSAAWAHHETPGKSHAVATVTIPQQVWADGKPLPPGTYEVWILGRPKVNPGDLTSDAQRAVELRQNGKVVGTEVAEVIASGDRPVGTSGTAGTPMGKAVVQKLLVGEFLRISISDAGSRYLIHLPTETFFDSATPPPSQP